MTGSTPKAALAAIRKRALSYPETVEDHPWGDRVIKVRGKIFVFLGAGKDGGVGMTAKLPATHALALTLKHVAPTGYGLGNAGWVTVQLLKGERIDLGLLMDWVDESYRAVAPRTLVKALDESSARPAARR